MTTTEMTIWRYLQLVFEGYDHDRPVPVPTIRDALHGLNWVDQDVRDIMAARLDSTMDHILPRDRPGSLLRAEIIGVIISRGF